MAGMIENTMSPPPHLISKTAEAPSTESTTSTAASSVEDIPGEYLLRCLARQMEYYFSTTNLSKDTYLQTLRELNDGYVPVAILANFTKVQSLVGFDSTHAVVKAVEYSDLLEVVSVDKQTGKQVSQVSDKTILAVGPIGKEPLPADSCSPSVPATAPSAVQNTIILRDVATEITEEQVRAVFDFSCPPIQSVNADVANCWFVTFHTQSRDDMMNILSELQTKTLAGQAVKARLKSGVAPTLTPIPLVSSFSSFTDVTQSRPQSQSSKSRKKKKNKKYRSNSNNNKKKEENKPKVQLPPPTPDQFPALGGKVQVVDLTIKAEEDVADVKKPSDSASTATTSSSSSTCIPKKGGYAAALLKAPEKTFVAAPVVSSDERRSDSPPATATSPVEAPKPQKEPEHEPVVVKPPTWGGGRSFADVLKKDEAAVSEASSSL